MRSGITDPDFFVQNRSRLIKGLKNNSIAIVHANDLMPRNGDQYFKFRQNSSFFYLTGLDYESCVLMLFKGAEEEEVNEYIFVSENDPVSEIWEGKRHTFEEVSEKTGISNVLPYKSFNDFFQKSIQGIENVYFNIDNNPKFQPVVKSPDQRFLNQANELLSFHNKFNLYPVITQLRLIKDLREVDQIKKSASVTDLAFRRILEMVKPGLFEYQVAAEIIRTFIASDNCTPAYNPIVASGRNGLTLHYKHWNSQLSDSDLLLLDFGAEYGYYATDCSRTIPVNGKFSSRQREVYESVLKVFTFACKLFVPGNTINSINQAVSSLFYDEIRHLGLDKGKNSTMHEKELVKKYFMHGVSHFMGLDVHDPGGKDIPLQKGMVLTCEPGLYISEENIAVRIETDLLVDDNPVDLLSGIPVEADEIEYLMSKN